MTNSLYKNQKKSVDFINKMMDKGSLKNLLLQIYLEFGGAKTATLANALKNLGYKYATKSIGKKITRGIIGIILYLLSLAVFVFLAIYANKNNKYDKKFKPVLLGVADVYGMHSKDEKIDIESYKKGYEFLKAIYFEFEE